MNEDPPPPALHWGVVLVLGIVTLGIFTSIWGVVQALWMKKVDAASKAIVWMAAHWVLAVFVSVVGWSGEHLASATLGGIASGICYITACFSIKYSLELYINRVTSAHVSLNGSMTFIFTATYLQYNMNVLRELEQSAYSAR